MSKEAENAELEKGVLQKKYVSQVEEFKEKDSLNKKIKRRYEEVKMEYDEVVESCNIDLKNLEEEN